MLKIIEDGLYHRSQRPIEPESVFGQTKSNKQYNRFRHFSKEKVLMDFAILTIAFNIGKLYLMGLEIPDFWEKHTQKSGNMLFLIKINSKSFSAFKNYNYKIVA